MANISAFVTKIRTAIMGQDVRAGIADAMEAVNADNVEIITLLDDLDPVDIAVAVVTATTKADQASASAADALDSEVAAGTAKTAAELAETHAETAETNAKASEVAAEASETAAAGSAETATTKAGESAASAAAALASEQAAAEHEATALAYKDATLAAVGGSTNLAEIIESRKGKASLGEKIETIDSQLADITNTIGKIKNNNVYGVRISKTNSNPSTRVAYIRDALGFTPMSGGNGAFSWGSWQPIFELFSIKPCLLKAGVVQYYLNPNNFAQKADGVTASDITSGNDGDVMIEFGKPIWYKWTDEGDASYTIEVSVSEFDGAVKNAFEIESGYNLFNYYPLLLTQILFVILFKSTDSQAALGRGQVDGTGYINSGGTDAKGMFWGSTADLQMKFLGIEDYWGNKLQWIDGVVSDASWNILIGKSSFNDTGSGYTSYSSGLAANAFGYINSVQGGNDKGFIVKTAAGSEATYLCDYGYLTSSRVAHFGGSYSSGSYAGFASLRSTDAVSSALASLGSRLFCAATNKMYIGAYLGYNSSSKLRSLSGNMATASLTIGAFRTLAKANN